MADNLFGGFADGLGQGFQIGQMIYNRQQQQGDQQLAGQALFGANPQDLAFTGAAGQAPSIAPGVQSVPRVQPGPTATPGSGMGGQQAGNPYINAAAQQYGVNPQALAREEMIESGGRDVMNTGGSGAAGRFQFMPSTARQYGVNPHDTQSATFGAAHLMADNKTALTKALGREPTDGELYLAHQQGAGGAIKLLSNPNAPAEQAIGRSALLANGGQPGMTSGQFASKWTNKFGGQPGPQAPQGAGAGVGMGGSTGRGLPGPAPEQNNQAPQQPPPMTSGLQKAVELVKHANPGATPAQQFRALQQVYPLLDKESQMVFKEQTLALKTQVADMQAALHTADFDRKTDKDQADQQYKAEEQARKREHEDNLGLRFDRKYAQQQQKIDQAKQIADERLKNARTDAERKQAMDLQKLAERKQEHKDKMRMDVIQKGINIDNDMGSDDDKSNRRRELDDLNKDMNKGMSDVQNPAGPEHEDSPQQGAPAATAQQAPQGEAKTVTSKAEYDALPPGTPFMYNGKRLVKGQQ